MAAPYTTPSPVAPGDAGITGAMNTTWQILKVVGGLNPQIDFGAFGDGSHDDTAALTSWIAAINAATGSYAVVPPGKYLVTSPLPAITSAGAVIAGAGWAQASSNSGSVLSAAAGTWVGPALFTVAAEGVQLTGLTLDGANHAPACLAITGTACQLINMQTRANTAGGVGCDIQAGGSSAWLRDSVFNSVNGGSCVQVNDTDLTMSGCKPKNGTTAVALLTGASGAVLTGNHLTAGTGNQNCLLVTGTPSHLVITGNRFDNYVQSALQLTPSATTATNYMISGNVFHSTLITDNTYAVIAVDTTNGGIKLLTITGNAAYATATNRPENFLASQVQGGAAAANPTRMSTLGTLVSGNTAWAATSFYAASSSPLRSIGNITTADGTTFASVPDL